MYHRIIPYKEAGPGLQAGMYVEPETFKMHLMYLKNRFNIMPLSWLIGQIKYDARLNYNKPTCFITFDDGWLDFYKYAYPILVEHKVPVTVFLPTKFIGTDDWFWTDSITKIFVDINNNNIKSMRIPSGGIIEKIINYKGSLDDKIENAISTLKKYREEYIYDSIMELESILKSSPVKKDRLFFNWDEAREMAESSIVTFGSHTYSHKILTNLNESEVLEELYEAKTKLIDEKAVDGSFIPFCYPNGNYDERIMRLIKSAGHDVSVTTESGWNDVDTCLLKLKRAPIHQDIASTIGMFGCRLINIL